MKGCGTICKAFSCIVTKQGKVIWKAGVDSHDILIEQAKIKDDTTDGDTIQFIKIEITPDKGYLHPEGKWTLKVDENTTPRWWNKKKEAVALEACEEWKTAIYSGINLTEALNPINPLKVKAGEVTEADRELLKKWASVGYSVRYSVGDSVGYSVGDSVGDSVGASVRASVGASVGASVRASVRDSVRASVWAYIGSLFTAIKKWEYVKDDIQGYPFQPAVDLWKRGFVASFDDTTWRLHAGEKAQIVYEISQEELRSKSNGTK